jgi:hypothetical protein
MVIRMPWNDREGGGTCAQHLAMSRRSGSGVEASMAGRAALMATCTMICAAHAEKMQVHQHMRTATIA